MKNSAGSQGKLFMTVFTLPNTLPWTVTCESGINSDNPHSAYSSPPSHTPIRRLSSSVHNYNNTQE